MLGYLLGAYTASITRRPGDRLRPARLGARSAPASRRSGPVEDLVIGALLLLVAFVLATDRDQPLRERRERRKSSQAGEERGEEKEALPMRLLGRGSPRIAFVVGLLLSFPGVSYLTGLSHIDKLDAGVAPTALLVIAFCLIQQMLLEVPLVGYILAPERTAERGRRLSRLARPQRPPAGIYRRRRARRAPRSSAASRGW